MAHILNYTVSLVTILPHYCMTVYYCILRVVYSRHDFSLSVWPSHQKVPGTMTLLPNFRPSSQSDEHARQVAPPSSSICLTGVMFSEGTITVSRSLENGERLTGSIRYLIFRPRQLHMLPAPLIVLHGGPGIPSNYLMNLVNVITDRTVIFYDQLGCGRSSRIMDKEAYSIQGCVEDFRALLKQWKLQNYHLFGHSFGGIVAFEHLKEGRDDKCLSVILSSVPTETKLVAEESKRLLKELDCMEEELSATFLQTHECRVVPTPLALIDAYAQAATIWRGIQAIPNYKASLDNDETTIDTPCCILRGQYDFVTEPCVQGWKNLFSSSQSTVLAGCSHHGLLENEQLYGDVTLAFLEDNDL